MQSKKLIVTAALAAVVLAWPAAAETWKVDDPHTEIKFSVKHFFTPVTGRFEDFDVEVEYDEQDPSKSRVRAKIAVASVDTGNEKRDAHLRSADWFDAERYPYITFESTSVGRRGDQLIAQGQLTIKDETQDVVLPITVLGKQAIPASMQAMLNGAQAVASFRTTTAVDRGDYGVGVGSWAGTMVVGSEVEIEILLEAHRM